MSQYLQIFTIGICALLLVSIVLSMIINPSFRDALLGGEGEANIFGILSVKGVAVVLLSGLFLGGMLFALQFDPVRKKYDIPIFKDDSSSLVDQIATETGGDPKLTQRTIELFLGDIKARMVAGETVPIEGFGTFVVHTREARKGRNPQAGEEINIQAAKVPEFLPSEDLKDVLNEG